MKVEPIKLSFPNQHTPKRESFVLVSFDCSKGEAVVDQFASQADLDATAKNLAKDNTRGDTTYWPVSAFKVTY